ncbi:MAG: hypothetical protein C4527_19670 [Candidatus Omnitrophota bacterium]|nr:MAG: hypothetical protein C4527_19670 [Candidatus Omnitrophota bacterium]
MRIYLSTPSYVVVSEFHSRFPDYPIYVLRSFGRPNADNADFFSNRNGCVSGLILDSGTWTLNNSATNNGINITREGYADYLRRFGQFFEFYFNYDSNHQPEGFSENIEHQTQLEKRGFNPVPVIHDIYGEEVDYYIKMDYKTIAIGSYQNPTPSELKELVSKLNRYGVSVHLFGCTRYKYLSVCPVFSSDSSSWTQSGSHGVMLFWNKDNHDEDKTDKILLKDYVNQNKKGGIPIEDYNFGDSFKQYLHDTFRFSLNDLYGLKMYHNRALVNIYYFAEMQARITKIHQTINDRSINDDKLAHSQARIGAPERNVSPTAPGKSRL